MPRRARLVLAVPFACEPLPGVDGGGTKCHALVAETTGAVCGFGVSGPANWEEVGIEAAGAAIRSAVREALSEAGAKSEDVKASTFGLAAVDFPSDEARSPGRDPRGARAHPASSHRE